MAASRTSIEVLRAAKEALDQAGTVTQAAVLAGVPYTTMQSRIREVRARANELERIFTTPDLPSSELTADELIALRKKKFKKKTAAAEARKLIPIDITVDGPIGLALFGDPHVDDDGTDIAALERHTSVIKKTYGMIAGNVGDYRNNWIGRLARLWAEQSTSAREAKTLATWLLHACPWAFLVGGNHDAWSGADDPIEWIAQQVHALHEPFQCRLELRFPNGKKIRVNARHDFKGRSEWNTAHGPSKAAQRGWRDHVLTCGHTHVSGYAILKDPSSGLISHALRVASYKVYDRHAVASGFPDEAVFNCPVVVIDPSRDDNDPRLINVILDPEVGADFVKFLRKRKAA